MLLPSLDWSVISWNYTMSTATYRLPGNLNIFEVIDGLPIAWLLKKLQSIDKWGFANLCSFFILNLGFNEI